MNTQKNVPSRFIGILDSYNHMFSEHSGEEDREYDNDAEEGLEFGMHPVDEPDELFIGDTVDVSEYKDL